MLLTTQQPKRTCFVLHRTHPCCLNVSHASLLQDVASVNTFDQSANGSYFILSVTIWNYSFEPTAFCLGGFPCCQNITIYAYQLLGNCQTKMFPLVLHISLPVHMSQPTIGYANPSGNPSICSITQLSQCTQWRAWPVPMPP